MKIKKLKNFGVEFNDLIVKLLEKDPVQRISWEQLRKHPFWDYEIAPRQLPEQPVFDEYLVSRDINPDEFYQEQERNAYFVPKIYKNKIDALRLSITAAKNI